jgi:hypothetical protein
MFARQTRFIRPGRPFVGSRVPAAPRRHYIAGMRTLLSCLALLVFACGSTPKPAQAPAPRTERFDMKVRQDFFDGLRGDRAALARAMATCDAALARDPRDAEAMVWHGAGLVAEAGEKFRAGDQAAGIGLWQRGLGEMNHAVELAPQNVGVRIPRGAVLLAMGPFVPEPQRSQLLHAGLGDYEATLALQRAYFGTLSLHAREQLLYGLVDGYAQLGDQQSARRYEQQMEREAAGSELLARAKQRADGEMVAGRAPCEQCHAR